MQSYGVSTNHIARVVNQLTRFGHVRNIRPIGGGIELARQPTDIPLGNFPQALSLKEKKMKKLCTTALIFAAAAVIAVFSGSGETNSATGAEKAPETSPNKAAVDRSRKTVQMLDNIFKQTIVLITDKYVHDEDDFAAGSAAVLLFENISKSGDNKIRLIDATGEPYDSDNVAKDDFEREAIKRLKAGAKLHEQVVSVDGKLLLRTVTPVPVVMKKCVMCHDHYADAKKGEPIGAISYTVPIE